MWLKHEEPEACKDIETDLALQQLKSSLFCSLRVVKFTQYPKFTDIQEKLRYYKILVDSYKFCIDVYKETSCPWLESS